MKFPKVETGVRRDDVWIQISPAYMLLPSGEAKRTRQRPPTSEVRLRHLHALQAARNHLGPPPAGAQDAFCAGLRLGGQHEVARQIQRRVG